MMRFSVLYVVSNEIKTNITEVDVIMTTKTTYKVGDKVRILDAEKIQFGSSYWNDGDITEVKRVLDDGRPCLARNDMKRFDRGLPLYSRELKYIEKVAEQVAKFKVGDKVRAVNNDYFEKGEVLTIKINDESGHMPINCTNGRGTFWLNLSDVELISQKPTKNQRIATLEQTVANLQAEVEALKDAQKAPTMTVKADVDVAKIAESLAKAIEKHSPNEQRKAVIAEAKAFVKAQKTDVTGRVVSGFNLPAEGKRVSISDVYSFVSNGTRKVCDAEFHINAEKRIVTVLLKGAITKRLYGKAIAKCAPDDVFNADIGKAIALGRALRLDVERFEKAVQPSDVVVGQVHAILWEENKKPTGEVIAVGSVSNSSFKYVDGGWASDYQILDDTEAQY